jgi:hypothetical protein
MQESVEFDLVLEIEVGRRFVQEENSGLLRQRARDVNALPLAARKVFEQPIGEIENFHLAHRPRGDLDVPFAVKGPKSLMRIAPHHDDVAHTERYAERFDLRNARDRARTQFGVDLVGGAIVPEHASRLRLQSPRQESEQRAFARAVRAEEASERSRRQFERKIG